MRTALFLAAVFAILCRISPEHLPNAVPMGALALLAGSCLPRRLAWLVPVAIMGITDFLIDPALGRPLMDVSRWIIYATFAAITLMGPLANRPKVGKWILPGLSLSASVLFFLTSNFGAWLVPELNYPRNLSGLLAAYVAGIPFFQNTVLADLIGTAVLFGMGALLERAASLVAERRRAVATIEAHQAG